MKASIAAVVIAGAFAAAAAAAIVSVPTAIFAVLFVAALLAGVLLFGYSIEYFVLALLVIRSGLDRLSTGGAVSPASLVGITVIATTVVWLGLRPKRKRFRRSRLEIALLCYLGAAGLSVFVSLRPSTSVVEFIRLASAICIFLIIERLIADGASERRLLLAVLASAPIPLLVAIYDIGTGGTSESKGDFDRLSSTFAQSNGFSRYLMVMMIIAIASLGIYRHWFGKLAILGACGIGGVALILTYTRASWIGAAMGMGLVMLSNKQYRAPAIATAAILLLVAAPTLGSRFADLGGSEQGDAAINSSNSLEWRLQYWADVIALADDSPLNGIGLGVTQKVTIEEKAPHSELIRAYVELGILGVVAYAFFMGALLHTGLSAWKRTTGQAHAFSIGYMASVSAFALVTLVTNALTQTALLWYLFALSSIALSLSRRRASELSDATPLLTELQSQWVKATTPQLAAYER